MVEEVREQVRAGGLLPADARVVTMLSGGRDSVCLLDVAVELCGAQKVNALHVNYRLRAEADGDEAHCRALCERLEVDLEVVRAERDPGSSGNLHAWARDLRYEASAGLADRHDALIATGHTQTDQLETILYRLTVSPGRRALLGISAREGRLVRPLLGLTREQTAEYCVERGLAWREDDSNDDPTYARARVRNQLLPALDAVHPSARKNILRTAELLRQESELLDDLVEAELNGHDSIAVKRLDELPPALARLVVIRLAERTAGVLVPQAGRRVSEIVQTSRRRSDFELHVGGLASAEVKAGVLRMKRIDSRMGDA
jgi:tRNA(Ile)-lysidine synthase